MLSKVLLMVMGVFMMNADLADYEYEQAVEQEENVVANEKPAKKSMEQRAKSEFEKLKKKI